MASALAAASRLKPELRLGQALSEFVTDLSDEQKARFNARRSQALASPPSIQDVRSLTAEIDRVHGGRCLGPRLIKLLETVQKFAAIGDIIIGGSQNIIACGVWSMVRLSLLLLTTSSSHLERLSVLFMKVGRSAPSIEKVAMLYSRSRDLQSSVYEYFIVVVHLCHDILKFTKRSAFQKLSSALSDSSLEKYNTEIDSWSKAIQDEVRYLMAKRNEEEAEATSRFRNASTVFFKSASSQQKAEVRQKIFDFCCQFEYMAPWKRIRKVGNTTLFRECPHYKSWRDQPDHRGPNTLIYTGKVGAGKSVVLANMIDDLHLHAADRNMAVVFFFARHDIPESLKARTVIGSLIQQLLDHAPDFTQIGEYFETTSRYEPFERMFCLLKSLLKPDFKAFVVIDGLDELSNGEEEETLQNLFILRELFQFSMCLSYRQESNASIKFKAHLKPFNATILPIPENTPEIDKFITEELERHIEARKLIVGDPLLLLEIREALTKGSQGMFLWVALQIESLCTMQTDEEIRSALKNLPKSLSETFSRILQRSNKYGSPYQKRILEMVLVAQRPLTTEELREALSVTPGATNWNPSQLVNNIYQTLESCGGLVVLDEEELTLHPVHHSFNQYLTTRFHSSAGTLVNVEQAHKRMSDILITYLHSVEFAGKEVAKEVIPELNAQSTMAGILRSTRSSMHGSSKLALRIIRSKSPLELNMGKTLAHAWNLRHGPKNHAFLRGYARAFWHVHISWSLPLPSEIEPLFQKLCDRDMLPAIETSENLENLFLDAVSTRSLDLTRYLIERSNVNVNCERDSRQGTALHIAVTHGCSKMIAVLLKSEYIDLDAMNLRVETPLELAARIGPSSIFEPFIAAGKVDRRDRVFSSLVRLAAKEGEDSLLTRLIKSDETVISHGATIWNAMNEATIWGHVSTVKLLLQYDGIPKCEAVMHEILNPLHIAVKQGDQRITEHLLKSGKVDIDTVDNIGWTPICLAVLHRNNSILQMLLNSETHHVDRLKALEMAHNGVMPLHLATAVGETSNLRLILASHDVYSSLCDLRGNTPLHLVAGGNSRILPEITLLKAPELAKDHSNIVNMSERLELLQMLLRNHGVRSFLNWQNHDGNTALHLAAKFGHLEIAQLLIETFGINRNKRNNDGDTPLHLAITLGHRRVVEMLNKTRNFVGNRQTTVKKHI